MFSFDPDHAPPWLPVIALDQDVAGTTPCVTSDPRPGLTETVAMLVGLKHRRFLWIGCDLTAKDSDDQFLRHWSSMVRHRTAQRERIIREAALGCQVETFNVTEPARARAEGAGDTVTSYLPGIRKALQQSDATAVLCYNDRIAVTAMAAASTLGKRVPDDISIVGYDNLHADLTIPQLTTISPELTALGTEAAHLVRQSINDREQTDRQKVVPTKLILRDSTAAAVS
ncbi:MAG: substrate-binding domain-containing protein [Planctomycetota bacterium]